MDYVQATMRARRAPQGSVNLSDFRNSVSQTRANFTTVLKPAGRSTSTAAPKPDLITFVSLACEVYQAQNDDLVPVQQYPSTLETYQGKGHTSLVTHAQVAISAPSGVGPGTIRSYTEGIVIKRPRRSILEEKTDDALVSFITELRIRSHEALRSHPSIAFFRGVGWDFEDEEATIPRPIILEEFAPQGALDNFWRNWKFVSLNFKAKLNFCMDIAEGLSALHHCGVVHGDVKPENILVFPRKDTRNSFSLKLTDFGHSVIEADRYKSLPAFTLKWSAPEVTKKKHMTFTQMKATDYYSYGLVTLSIMLGRPFYTDIEDTESFKEDGSLLLKLVRLVEQEDRSQDDSDLEVGTIVRLLHKTVQVNYKARSLEECISIIETHRIEDQTATHVPSTPAPLKTPSVSVPALNVVAKVCAENPEDPRTPAAAWELTICYFSGFGVPRDFDRALEWLSLARDHHVSAAQEFFKPLQEAIAVAKEAQINDNMASVEQVNASLEGESSTKTTANDVNATLSQTQPGLRSGEERSEQRSTTTIDTLADTNHSQDPSIEAILQKYLDDSKSNPNSAAPTSPAMADHVRHAIETGALNQLRESINSDPAQINSIDVHGNTPLLLAADHKQVSVLRYLLSCPDVEVQAHNNSGQTALHFLAEFEDEYMAEFVESLASKGIDLSREALPMRKAKERLIFFSGLRCCPMLNAILHDRVTLLRQLLEAAHLSSQGSFCQICEAGSRFRRILAVALSLFRVDMLELLSDHLMEYSRLNVVDLANIQVWAGHKLLRLYQVPFSSVAVSAMDIPESFFRAIIYGAGYVDILERTLDFLSTIHQTKNSSSFLLEVRMLRAATDGGSLDAVDSLLRRMKRRQSNTPAWLISRGDVPVTPLDKAIRFGFREIFDRILADHASSLREEVHYTCQDLKHLMKPVDAKEMNCFDDSPVWKRSYRRLLGQDERLALPDGHIHDFTGNVLNAVETSISNRHRDTYFLSRIIDEARINRSNSIYIGILHRAITNLNFKAAAILLGTIPEALRLHYGLLPSPPDIVFYGLGLGNIIRNRPDRKALWNVVIAQISTGHSISGDHLKLAVDCSNTEALREMLDMGCAVNGLWRDYFDTPLQHALDSHSRCDKLKEDLEIDSRSFTPAQQNMVMDLHGTDGPPALRDPNPQTHSEIYNEYYEIRRDQLVNLYLQKLNEATTILREHGGRTSPFPFFTKWVALRAWTISLQALLYLGVLPNVLVFATQKGWQQATMGQKFAFAYLWALLSYAVPPVQHLGFLMGWIERRTRIFLYIFFPAIFLFNHIGVPYIVIGHGWRPFRSCEYFVENDQLGSKCVDYTFLLPLAVAGLELAILSVFLLYDIKLAS
ncbi:hypothetical protein CSOJ01_08075 [Colletotrichum sojae]|uniref:Protein kinase domain-containing protein n=1 Tax=Colletotrichum sojae TaxID=2175907 RepID=A0A8H6MSQ3_9PEZI|nr:hypothetical protein CSOJ01_08075 [Colletotrichum sojae]